MSDGYSVIVVTGEMSSCFAPVREFVLRHRDTFIHGGAGHVICVSMDEPAPVPGFYVVKNRLVADDPRVALERMRIELTRPQVALGPHDKEAPA
jgi:hypothetical protein